MTHSPSYLAQNPHGYYFRMRVPRQLQDRVGKGELRFSLKTGNLCRAKTLARHLAFDIQNLFNAFGRENIFLKKLTPKRVNNLIRQYRDRAIEDAKRPVNPFKNDPSSWDYEMRNVETDDELYGFLHELSSLAEWYRFKAVTGDYTGADAAAEKLCKDKNITYEKDTTEFCELCRGLLNASSEAVGITLDSLERECPTVLRKHGHQIGNPKPASIGPLSESQHQGASPVTDLPPSISLKDLINEYQDERVKAGRWKEGTIRNYQPYFVAMMQYLGSDSQVGIITRQQVLDYKKLLSSLPPGFARLKKYKDISGLTLDALAGKVDKKMDITTLRGYIQMAESVFSFGVRNGYMEKNPAEGLKPPKKKLAREQRQAFDESDLQKLFHIAQYVDDKHTKPYRFWLPVLGLYTGCRLEELCQLYVEDVKQVEGIWCLDINGDKDKRLKNESSDRMIPLHPVLLDLNFPGFVEKIQAEGQERVFPELKKQSGAYGHYASRWFATFKEKAGIDMAPNQKVFHSFRHNFTDTLYKNMVMETVIEELTGRAGKTETSRRYAKGYNIKDLFEVVSGKLNYPVDLSHLKRSKFVIK